VAPVFSNLNVWEVAGLVLLGLFLFGPDRLPKVIGDGIRLLRKVRTMARDATNDLSRELGTEVKLEDLHPKTFIRKHVLSEEDEALLRAPFTELSRDVRSLSSDVDSAARGIVDAEDSSKADPAARQHRSDPDAT
jgi:sec-independent protein translocase protein TatB